MQSQHLEQRLLLSSVTYIDGVVRITGSPKPDEIEVHIIADLSGPSAFAIVNGHRSDFTTPDQGADADLPRKVIIKSAGGDDAIELKVPFTGVIARINAGRGNDNVTVFNQRDSIIKGGSGDDVISVDGSGFEFGHGHTVAGGAGDDLIRSSAIAEDVFKGGDGDDTLVGGEGDDVLKGGPGDDLLKGGSGDDVLKGGSGIDRFFGAAGNDRLFVSKKEKFDPGKGRDNVLR